MPKTQDDEIVMRLVELAMNQPPERREACLRDACAGNRELFAEAWEYVRWNDRMRDFLLEPLCSPPQECPHDPADGSDENATKTVVDWPVFGEYPIFPGDLLLSRFRIVHEVARGGMGIVYEAHDEKLGRRIALKCARRGYDKRLPHEVRHASQIGHPNVCRIFEIHTASTAHGEIDFFTMEFLDGETLRARLSRGPLPPREALTIGRQICGGLAEAHRNNVVHGDLKSSNVILARDADGNLRAVITDFGLARGPLGHADEIAGVAAMASHAGGTPSYMAPELWKGDKPSIGSDVYALGVTLYELVANRRPYPPDVPWQERIKAPPVPHVWNPVLQRCLDPERSRRFRDAGEVAAALEPPRSRRWWVGAAAAIILASVSGWVTYQRATAPAESIRLAMLPLQPDPSYTGPFDADLAARISREAAGELTRLAGGKRARLSSVPWAAVIGRHVDTVEKARATLGATHVVQGVVAWVNGKVVLHVFLTDALTPANDGDWTVEYTPGEVRHAARAITGMVTYALRLPPPRIAPVNASAMQDYTEGVRYTRRNSTIDNALPLLDRAAKADPDSPLTWAGLAEAQYFKYFITKDATWLDQARAFLRKAQARDLDLAPVHRVAGELQYRDGFTAIAEAEYQRARDLEPDDAENYWRLGQVYDRDNRIDDSLKAYRKATELDPRSIRACQGLGTFYRNHGNFSEAARRFLICVRLEPGDADAHFALGTTYSDMSRYADAERELRRSIEISPTPKALNSLAETLISQRKDEEAIPVYLRAVQLSSSQYLLWMNVGSAYRRTNRKEEASEAYLRARGLAAQEILRNPSDDTLRANLAYLYARLGDSPGAEYELGQALHGSSDTTTLEEAVEVYEILGEHAKAQKIWENLPHEVLLDICHSPDLADLCRNSRFQELLASNQMK